MPTGTNFTFEQRLLLAFHFSELNNSPAEALESIFGYLEPWERPLETTLRDLWAKFRSMTTDEFRIYKQHSNMRVTRAAGSKRKHFQRDGAADTICINKILAENRSVTMPSLKRRFYEDFCSEYETILPSISTMYRYVRRGNTRKLCRIYNVRADPEQEYEYLKKVEHVDAEDIIDCDGMVQTADDCYQRYGWAPPGEEVRRMQIVIGGQSHAVLAAYCTNGFKKWKVFNAGETVSDQEVKAFIESLAPYIRNKTVAILDNASNQRTDCVRIALERIFRGKYYYCSPYSPWLKPIERGFSMVKKYIRTFDHDLAEWDPKALIEHAFAHFKEGTVAGQAASAHFNIYRNNHQSFILTSLL
jgi:transposase